MIDWLSSMQQTYEYYIVDPKTWKDSTLITTVKSCTINRDAEAETLGSAALDVLNSIGERYIRVYLVVNQNGAREKVALGTFLVQTPSMSFNGKTTSASIDAYTPLIELKENKPDIGYYIPKDDNVMNRAYMLTREHVRAPVIKPNCDTKNAYDFVADISDSWLSYLTDFISNHIYEDENNKNTIITKYRFDLDELGRILFVPEQDAASLRPVWTYNDDGKSILYPEIKADQDLYGVPNVVEVIYSNGTDNYYSRVVNDDPNSLTSTVNRGREIVHRITDPDLVIGKLTQEHVDEYATRLLKELSSIDYTITYTHGYCPVRLGDCVLINYARAGLTNIKAKVISQTIKCEPGCPVTEKAVFTTSLWG